MNYANKMDDTTKLFKSYAAKAKKSSREPKFKFGIQVPYNYKQSQELDRFNKDNLWQEAVDREVNQSTIIPHL